MKSSVGRRSWYCYVYLLDSVLDLIRCSFEAVFLHHGNNSVITHFSSLWSFRAFIGPELVSLLLLFKNCAVSLIASFCFINLMMAPLTGMDISLVLYLKLPGKAITPPNNNTSNQLQILCLLHLSWNERPTLTMKVLIIQLIVNF